MFFAWEWSPCTVGNSKATTTNYTGGAHSDTREGERERSKTGKQTAENQHRKKQTESKTICIITKGGGCSNETDEKKEQKEKGGGVSNKKRKSPCLADRQVSQDADGQKIQQQQRRQRAREPPRSNAPGRKPRVHALDRNGRP